MFDVRTKDNAELAYMIIRHLDNNRPDLKQKIADLKRNLREYLNRKPDTEISIVHVYENGDCVFKETLPDFLEATGVTVRFGIVAIIIAIFWGILIGSINFRKVKGVSLLTRAYVCFFRETPLLVQIYFLFYGLSRLMKVSPSVIGVIALVLNDGAFIAEIIRGALQSLDKGQEEAASSLGFSKIQTLVYFLIPQAVRQSQDSIMNMVAIIIKDTSLLYTLRFPFPSFNS